MAEVLGIIGAIGSIASIIDATSKVISIISDVQGKWKDADLILLSLASQLSAFRAALRRIDEWVNSQETEPHHQLTMDLDETLAFCGLLVNRIENLFAGWQSSLENPTASSTRWKVAFRANEFDKVFVLVERQTTALTLLLTACNCKTLSKQKYILEKPKARKVLKRAKADSASLFVHRDATSFRSKFTDNLSKISVVFDFDKEVFSTVVYHRVLRASLKHRLRDQQGNYMSPQQPENTSENIIDTSAPTNMQSTMAQRFQSKRSQVAFIQNPKLRRSENVKVLSEIQICNESMLRDCSLISRHIAKQKPELRDFMQESEHGEDTEQFIHDLWRHPDFPSTLDYRLVPNGSVSHTEFATQALEGPYGMPLCTLLIQQLKAFRDGRLLDQVKECIRRLELGCYCATMQHRTPSGHTDFDIHTVWTYPYVYGKPPALTIVISIPMNEDHFASPPSEGFADDIGIYLQPLLSEVGSGSSMDISFVLLLNGQENLITNISDYFIPQEQGSYLDLLLDQIIQSFRKAKPVIPCEYTTLWSSVLLNSYILDTLNSIARKGQVTKHDGVLRARLIPTD